MNPLRNSAGASDEGTDRLWRLLNIVLLAGSVGATVLAVGIVIALFFWLYTLRPVEPERVSRSLPPGRQAQPAPKAPEPVAADPAPQGPAVAAVPPAPAPAPSSEASPADPEAAQRAASTRRQRSRRAPGQGSDSATDRNVPGR